MHRQRDDAAQWILRRRRQFVAAALAGLAGCQATAPGREPAPAVTVSDPPEVVAEPEVEKDAEAEALPQRERPMDTDKDGIADQDDDCPDQPGSDPDHPGCPDLVPSICLSVY
ncbi:MAG: hypothetical protein R3B13_03655 [Polyangiaceae bacterium]